MFSVCTSHAVIPKFTCTAFPKAAERKKALLEIFTITLTYLTVGNNNSNEAKVIVEK